MTARSVEQRKPTQNGRIGMIERQVAFLTLELTRAYDLIRQSATGFHALATDVQGLQKFAGMLIARSPLLQPEEEEQDTRARH